MYIELIDLLRCPREHEESWLVAAFTAMYGRFVLSGKLGCPVCAASFAIRHGIADFRNTESTEEAESAEKASTHSSRTYHRGGAEATSPENETVRMAALLGLTKPGALVVLEGVAAARGIRLSELTDARAIALDPRTPPADTERVATILTTVRLPFATASVDGVVLDHKPTDVRLSEAGRVLKPGGRLVAPAGTPVGPQFRELAHDDSNVVAESVGPLVGLSR